ncbi:peptidoglycan-binding protein [Clostridium sp.]|uniref:peptidoglycan-binding protein n=1 Tax=Clostridium sp. TaxID=1506 RepID=UPI003464B31C
MPQGLLRVQLFQGSTAKPVENAKIIVTPTGETATRQTEIDLVTDSSGLSQAIPIEAPPFENSQNPTGQIPYSFVDLRIEARGFNSALIKGAQIYPNVTALQQFNLQPDTGLTRVDDQIILVEQNTLVGNFPPKIYEDPNKPLPKPTGGVVLPQPVVPEFVIVHQGVPDDPSAPNYTVPFRDYIKNVACCEIFATWPESTIRANIYCIISFTLNRIYTEWYPSKGKNFDITSSTAYDHAFNYGRNIYDNISRIVDEIFSSYMKRPGRKQPLLAQYCDGVKVQCPGWLTQWGSKYLGDQGVGPFDILTSFYGTDLTLEVAEKVEGIPRSWPGYTLVLGSRGEPVRTIQEYLNRISQNYPAIPKTAVDGVYGPKTKEAVRTFQEIFTLPATGNTDYATWYKISAIYVGVTEIAELRSLGDINRMERRFFPPVSYDSYRSLDVPSILYWDDSIK